MDESRAVLMQQRLFINRERVRRELIHTRPGETICLNSEQTQLLLKWIKELETNIKDLEGRLEKHGSEKR